MADIFDVIADRTRRDILVLLQSRADDDPDGTSVSLIVQGLEVSQPTVSKHLRVLREAGLVGVREEGQHRLYRVEPAPLETVQEWIAALVPEQPTAAPVTEAVAPVPVFVEPVTASRPVVLPPAAAKAAVALGRLAASLRRAVAPPTR